MNSTKIYEWEPLAWLVGALRVAVAFVSSYWTSADADIKILCVLAAMDFVTSALNRVVPLLLVCRRLAVTFFLVGGVHYVYGIAKAQTGLNLGFDVSAIVSTFYCLGEGVVILRNVDALGLKLPPKILDLLVKAEGLTGKEKNEIIALKLKQGQEETALELKIAQSKEPTEEKIIKP